MPLSRFEGCFMRMSKISKASDESGQEEYSLRHLVAELRGTESQKPPDPIFSKVSPVKYVVKTKVRVKRASQTVLKRTAAEMKRKTYRNSPATPVNGFLTMKKGSKPSKECRDEYSLRDVVDELRATQRPNPPNPIFSQVSPVKYVVKTKVREKRASQTVLKRTAAEMKQKTSRNSPATPVNGFLTMKKGSKPSEDCRDEYSLRDVVDELRATRRPNPPNPIFSQVSPIKYMKSIRNAAQNGSVDVFKPKRSGRGLHTEDGNPSGEEITARRTRKKARRFVWSRKNVPIT